jgi:hypothetical protein
MPSMLCGRRHAAAVAIDTRIYAFGGTPTEELNDSVNSCEVFDVVAQKWTLLAAMPHRRAQSRAVVIDNGARILLLGGSAQANTEGASTSPSDTITEYTIATNTWRTCDWKLPRKLSNSSAAIDHRNGDIMIAFGWPFDTNACYIRSLPYETTDWMAISLPVDARSTFGFTS